MSNTDVEEEIAEEETGETYEEIEARARRSGWIPEEEWDDDRAKAEGRRKPREFVSPGEFLARMDAEAPVLRERNRFLDHEVAERDDKLGQMSSEIKDLRQLVEDLHRTSKEIGQRAYDKAMRELTDRQRAVETRMKQAVEEADTPVFEETARELAELDDERKKLDDDRPPDPTEGAKRKPDPYVKEWVEQNPWYDADQDAKTFATALHGQLLGEQPGWSLRQNLAEVRKRVVKRFPELFENERRRGPATVSAPSGDRGNRRGGKIASFEDLSQEQKDAYDRQSRFFKVKGQVYTKQQFLEDQMLE